VRHHEDRGKRNISLCRLPLLLAFNYFPDNSTLHSAKGEGLLHPSSPQLPSSTSNARFSPTHSGSMLPERDAEYIHISCFKCYRTSTISTSSKVRPRLTESQAEFRPASKSSIPSKFALKGLAQFALFITFQVNLSIHHDLMASNPFHPKFKFRTPLVRLRRNCTSTCSLVQPVLSPATD